MARSMTGFGMASVEIGQSQYTVEVRSVNNRYFKAGVRLPEVLSGLETDVEQRLRERLKRGSVYCVVRVRGSSAEAAYEINAAALERYIDQIDSLRPDASDIPMTVDMATLLTLPGACNPPDVEELTEKLRPQLLELVEEALENVLAMRKEEGKSVTADLSGLCETLSAQLRLIVARAPQVVLDYHARLKRRVEELLSGTEVAVNQQDLARELAVFAERCDINEEIVRLTQHVEQFRATLAGDDQPGRKLDFIAQEMLREANTIGSKSNDGEIALRVVEIKTAIDRIKEQVQNVE